MTEDREPFLDRWSRRKTEEREAAKEAQAPEQPPAAPPANVEDTLPALPKIDELTPQSDFRPFMNAGVDPLTRRAALKKLFADAHFNVPDPYEAYSEDYTVGEPIPPEMLKALNQAKKLLFNEEENVAQAGPQESPSEEPQTPPVPANDGAGSKDA